MKSKKLAALLLSLLLLIGALPTGVFAAESAYVLMNIPYADFYRVELGTDGAADAVSSATRSKRSNGGLALGSYHVGAEGAGIDGVIYPVLVPDVSVLDAAKEITDADSVTVSTTARGTTTETTYEGKDALFEAPDYAWYKLGETPSYYKELTVAADGSWSFGAVVGETSSVDGVTAALTYNGRHTDIELVLSGTTGVETGDAVSAVIVTTADGKQYGLGHVTNIWRGVQLGWDKDDVLKTGDSAATITNIRYIKQDAVIDYPVNIRIEARGAAGFTDIPDGAWYAGYAAWAVENGFLSNRGDGKFNAAENLSRAAIMTYLWAAAGSPDPTLTENPFTDVAESDAYYKAVLWAKEKGITDGEGNGIFAPDATVDRATIATFLWKQAKRPAPKTQANPFADVAEGAWYRDAVLWAVENGVTDGMDGGFAPDTPVSKAQIVDFLYKDYAATLLTKLQGSFIELFPEMSREKYLPVWREVLAPYCGDDAEFETYYQMFTANFMRDLYGQEAVDAYAADPESTGFNCNYLLGVASIQIDGDTISGKGVDGKELFRHSYTYVEDEPVTYSGQEMGVSLHVYKSDDPDSGDFTYFAFADDTPAGTYHLEFRYGASEEGIADFTAGQYAYWLVGAIPEGYSDELMTDCITLFVTENMEG